MINKKDLESEAVSLVRGERDAWENATAFVTDKVAFNMRNLIRTMRKNYWGVFDKPVDPVTGLKKVWIPMSEWLVDTTVKQSDIDRKDMKFRAKNPSAIGLTKIIRNLAINVLDSIFFGEKLNDLERQLAIDGTRVWKTLDGIDPKTKKRTINIVEPDLLNLYIDPAANNIQDAYRFTERGLLSVGQIKSMDWINTAEVRAEEGLSATDSLRMGGNESKNTKAVDVWETWGLIPEYLITGNNKDTQEIEGHIVVSGIDTPGKELVHLVERNEGGLKPYEEAFLIKVPGRWYGKGVCEKVMWLQLWLNTIVNIRINRSRISQLGIFKIKKGSGVTPQMLSRLASNGAVMVNDTKDIEQFVMQEASAASYKDEDNAITWAQRITSSFETATGEGMAASTPATNAAIQSASSQSYFTLIKENLGFFLDRWVQRHFLPLMIKGVKLGDIVRCSGDVDEIKELDQLLVNKLLCEQLEKANSQGLALNPMQVLQEKERAMAKLESYGGERYIKLLKKIDVSQFDVEFDIGNEKLDKNIMYQQLASILSVVPEYKDQIMEYMFDLMGITLKKPQIPMMQQMKVDKHLDKLIKHKHKFKDNRNQLRVLEM